MKPYDFDLLVIGAGSGGVRAARIAASHGAKVGICEHDRVGGTCVIRGCIPKKLLIYGAHYRHDFEHATHYGWSLDKVGFDWQAMIANKDREINRLNGVYLRLLEEAGVRLFPERAVFKDAHTLQLGDKDLSAETILIATGDRPVVPDIPGAELGITSDEAFHLDALPGRIAILGAGYIGVEFASIFNGFGSHVTQIYRGEQILRGFDDDVREAVADGLRGHGVDLRLGVNVVKVERHGKGVQLTLSDQQSLHVDRIMFATGRAPNTGDLGCEAAGVTLDKNDAVHVDEYSRTSVDNIFAVGDVTDRMPLTPVALMEGQRFAETVFGGARTKPDHENVPTAVFSIPQAASVGLTESEARLTHRVHVYRSQFTPLRHTLTGHGEKNMMKLVVDEESDRVLGCHMVGEDAAEIIQGVAVAMKCGATKAHFDATVGIHPTAGEEFLTMRAPAGETVAGGAQ